METWLDKIKQPARVERLLEAMATRSGCKQTSNIDRGAASKPDHSLRP